MIEHRIIDGRPATVAYMDRNWNPVDDPDEAPMVKVMFDDGQVLFLTSADDKPSSSSAEPTTILRKASTSLDILFDAAIQKDDDSYSFDLYAESTQERIRAAQDALITALDESSRDTVDQIVIAGAQTGLSADDIVTDIRETIGLTDPQAQAVINYRNMLEQGDDTALDRAWRDDTADDEISAAIEAGEDLDPDRIDELVDAYRDNALDYRANSIAVTETSRAVNMGLRDSYTQAIDDGVFSDDAVRRFWQIGPNPCPICEAIPDLNPDGVAVDEDFDSDDGDIDDPPVHTSCQCSVDYVTDLDKVPDDGGDDEE